MNKPEKLEENYIRSEDYKGWDPYDALNSQFINKITSFHLCIWQMQNTLSLSDNHLPFLSGDAHLLGKLFSC